MASDTHKNPRVVNLNKNLSVCRVMKDDVNFGKGFIILMSFTMIQGNWLEQKYNLLAKSRYNHVHFGILVMGFAL